HLCSWPGELELKLNDEGGTFVMTVRQDARGKVYLPGSSESWPQGVVLENVYKDRPIVVRREGRVAFLVLDEGEYRVEGGFRWEKLPEFISVPDSVAVVKLNLLGEVVNVPTRNDRGELWLRRRMAVAEQTVAGEKPQLNIEVSRKLSDSVPQKLETVLTLRVSGHQREERIGQILPEGFQPLSVSSGLSYQFDEDFNLRLNVKPGTHSITVDARIASPQAAIKIPIVEFEGWPAQEYWAWQTDESLRSVRISGGNFVDASRAVVPAGWNALPLFSLEPGGELKFEEIRRGVEVVEENRITLNRKLKLSTDGEWFSVEDTFSGSMNKDWRLNAADELKLGRVEFVDNALGGTKQLITHDPKTNKSGVEVRDNQLRLNAQSRLPRSGINIPAVGWDSDVAQLSVSLELPPGWSILWSSGADSSGGESWKNRWNTTNILILVVFVAVALRLLGWRWAIGYLILAILPVGSGTEWSLLVAGGLQLGHGKLSEGFWKKVVGGTVALLLALLVISIASQSYGLLKSAFAPDHRYVSYEGMSMMMANAVFDNPISGSSLVTTMVGGFFAFLGGRLIALVMVVSFLVAIIFLVKRSVRKALFLFILAAALFVLRSSVGLFFGANFEGARFDMQKQQATSFAASDSSQVDYFDAPSRQPGYGSGLASSMAREMKVAAPKREEIQKRLQGLDKNAITQTGAGVSTWTGRNAHFSWIGEVGRDEKLGIIFLSPCVNSALMVLRALLLWLLVLPIVKMRLPNGIGVASKTTVVALLLLVVFPRLASAEVPQLKSTAGNADSEVADEDDGQPKFSCSLGKCVSGERLHLKLSERDVTITARLHIAEDAVWIVPGPLSELYVEGITVDGKETKLVRRGTGNFLWLRLKEGVRDVEVKGVIAADVLANLQFPVAPGYFSSELQGWTIDSSLGGEGTGVVTLSRLAESQASSTAAKPELDDSQQKPEKREKPLPFWYLVRREVVLTLPWTVQTTVTRQGETSRPSHLKLPLLPGESVTSSTIEVEGQMASLSFKPGAQSLNWESTVPLAEELRLVDHRLPFTSEEWAVECSEIFSCETMGINPLSYLNGENRLSFRWMPFSGEEAAVKVSRPLGVEGKTFTITSSSLSHSLNARRIHSTLTLEIESSQGGFHVISLPQGAKVVAGKINGRSWNFMSEKNKVTLPLQTGKTTYTLEYSLPRAAEWLERVPGVEFGTDSVNGNITFRRPIDERYFWFSSAQKTIFSPRSFLLGNLIIMTLVAVLVARGVSPDMSLPVSAVGLMYLGFGLSFVGWSSFVVLAISFVLFALAVRENKRCQARGRWFTVGALVFGIYALMDLAGGCLGLLHNLPLLGVYGQGSGDTVLNWAFDALGHGLPAVSVLLVPEFVLQIISMLWVLGVVLVLYNSRRWFVAEYLPCLRGLWTRREKAIDGE
ncbi:MAG: hypothetical protein PHC51_13645, partial [bacterium]|nr:hypothetical protein [bacterium]